MPARKNTTSTKQTPDPEVVADKVATATKAPAKPRTPRKAAAPKVDTTKLADEARAAVAAAIEVVDGKTKAQRVKAAMNEQKALKQWESDGGKGERPATPNFDAINTEAVNGGEKPKPKKSKGNGTPRGERSERGEKANAARSANNRRRPEGFVPKRISHDEVIAYIQKVLKDHPGARLADERPYFFWIEGYSFDSKMFTLIWEAITNGTAIPEAVVKPEPKPKADKPAAEAEAETKAEAKPKTPRKAAAKAEPKVVTPPAETPKVNPASGKPKAKPAQAAAKKVTPPKATTAVRKAQAAERAKVRAEAGK